MFIMIQLAISYFTMKTETAKFIFNKLVLQWNPGLTIFGITIFAVRRSIFVCPAKVIVNVYDQLKVC